MQEGSGEFAILRMDIKYGLSRCDGATVRRCDGATVRRCDVANGWKLKSSTRTEVITLGPETHLARIRRDVCQSIPQLNMVKPVSLRNKIYLRIGASSASISRP